MKIGIVVCNYNKKDYLIKCLDSILASTIKNIDVYVVDNASTDGSADCVANRYGAQVILLRNSENLGGSGGFNTGLREAMKKNYTYLMCVDNDVVMEPDNIEQLYAFLQSHPDVGMAGSKICRMDAPERLQEMGADIDFDACTIRPHFKDYLDDETLPIVQYCDYVPACSLMVRQTVIDKVGLMPEENFIYWDDMEWGYLANRAGYKVASCREAKVCHAMGTNSGTDYFSTYYFWRNRLRFFLKYAPFEGKSHALTVLLENLFQTLYGCHYKGKENQIKVMMYAFDDAVHGVVGKAAAFKLLPKDIVEDRLLKLLAQYQKIKIVFDGNMKLLKEIIKKAEETVSGKEVILFGNETNLLRAQYPAYQTGGDYHELPVSEGHALTLYMCQHVSGVTYPSTGIVYIDGYGNLLADERDREHFRNYDYNKKLFMKCLGALVGVDDNEFAI